MSGTMVEFPANGTTAGGYLAVPGPIPSACDPTTPFDSLSIHYQLNMVQDPSLAATAPAAAGAAGGGSRPARCADQDVIDNKPLGSLISHLLWSADACLLMSILGWVSAGTVGGVVLYIWYSGTKRDNLSMLGYVHLWPF